MTSALLAAAILAQIQAPIKPVEYRLQATMEGFLPVLGGNEGKFEADLRLRVEGRAVAEKIEFVHEVSASELKFDGEKLPLDLETIRDFFPKTTLQANRRGAVLTSNAPDKAPAIRIPGLDPKRLADTVFLPLILPAEPIDKDSMWSFQRTAGGSEMRFDCRVTGLTGSELKITYSLAQSYTQLENAALEVVQDRASAENEVSVDLKGTGEATFSLEQGRWVKSLLRTTATRATRPITGGEVKPTTLKSTFEITSCETK